jgi:hypothetical protein
MVASLLGGARPKAACFGFGGGSEAAFGVGSVVEAPARLVTSTSIVQFCSASARDNTPKGKADSTRGRVCGGVHALFQLGRFDDFFAKR